MIGVSKVKFVAGGSRFCLQGSGQMRDFDGKAVHRNRRTRSNLARSSLENEAGSRPKKYIIHRRRDVRGTHMGETDHLDQEIVSIRKRT
jgi:hypothetical protein